MKKLIISEKAEEDLAEIWFYIAQDSQENADRFLDRLYEQCRSLVMTPYMGKERPELAKEIRSFPVENYVIFYRVSVVGIEIARVLSGRRDIPPLFG